MVHPNVPCILFTPICPHSLSFRPIVFPDRSRLRLKVPDSRATMWASFDDPIVFPDRSRLRLKMPDSRATMWASLDGERTHGPTPRQLRPDRFRNSQTLNLR
eukprot:659375-Pyramimonas_sp.AAC.1